MKLRLRPRAAALGLVILLILVMANQVGFVLSVGATRFPLTVADVVLVLAFIGVALLLASRRLRGLRLPPVPAFLLVAVAIVAFMRTEGQFRTDAAKEVLQLIEYFLVAYFVFVNVAETSDLKPLLLAFAAATAIVILWGAIQYLTCDAVLDVRAGFLSANHNLLGAFLALALPFFYGIALHARWWRTRLVLLLLVVLGLCVNLSGGTLLVTLVVLGVLSAIRGQRALIPYAICLGLALLFGSSVLPRAHHSDTLVSSAALYVDDNFLLSDPQLAERAQELLEPTQPIRADKTTQEMVVPAPRPLDAARLLRLLGERRNLTRDEAALRLKAQRAKAALSQMEQDTYPLARPQISRRYQRWNAAIVAARTLWQGDPKRRPSQRADLLFGCGLGPYHEYINAYMGDRLPYRTDEPEVFNIAAAEPFTHNLWLKTFVQTGLVGLLALAWLMGSFLGRAARLYREAHGELALGVALGALGGILGFAFGGIFTEGIVRGLAIPFVFVLATIPIAERIVRGAPRLAIDKLMLRD